MTILFTTDHYLPTINGIVTHILLLKEELEKRGHTVYIVSQTSKFIRKKDKNIFYLPSFTLPIRAKDPFTFPFHPLVRKQLLDLPIDIIHNHMYITGYFGMEIAKEKHLPFITTYHTFFRQYADWVIPWAKKVAHPTANWMAREYFKNNNAVIAPSQKAVNELKQARVKSPIYLMPNGIHVDRFKNSTKELFLNSFHLNSHLPLVVIVGMLENGKNVDLAIESIALLKEAIPAVHLAIVGDGKLRKKLELLIKKKNVTKNITITGFVNQDLVASANQAANVVLFTSDTDNFPTVLIEANAAGKPIVAVKDKAVEDLVKDHQNGFIVRKNPQAIAQRVYDLLSNPPLARLYGNESYQLSQQFSIEHYVDRLEALYTLLKQN